MPGLRNIVPPNRYADLVYQHVPDLFRSVHGLKQRCPEYNGNCIRDVLVLGNGVDLIRCEIAKADEIFERDHSFLPKVFAHDRALLVRAKDHSSHGVIVRSEQRSM